MIVENDCKGRRRNSKSTKLYKKLPNYFSHNLSLLEYKYKYEYGKNKTDAQNKIRNDHSRTILHHNEFLKSSHLSETIPENIFWIPQITIKFNGYKFYYVSPKIIFFILPKTLKWAITWPCMKFLSHPSSRTVLY